MLQVAPTEVNVRSNHEIPKRISNIYQITGLLRTVKVINRKQFTSALFTYRPHRDPEF